MKIKRPGVKYIKWYTNNFVIYNIYQGIMEESDDVVGDIGLLGNEDATVNVKPKK